MQRFKFAVKVVEFSAYLTGVFGLALLMALAQPGGGQVMTTLNMLHQRPVFQVMDVDRRIMLDILLPVNGVRAVELAPDGRKAWVYAANENLQTQVLYIFSLIDRRIVLSVELYQGTDIFTMRQPYHFDFRWSPDSRYLTFTNPASDGYYLVDMIARSTRHILQGQTMIAARWSPDSRYLMLLATGQRANATWMIYDPHTGYLMESPAEQPSAGY